MSIKEIASQQENHLKLPKEVHPSEQHPPIVSENKQNNIIDLQPSQCCTENEAHMFTKSPSYFLEVEEESILIEDEQESDHNSGQPSISRLKKLAMNNKTWQAYSGANDKKERGEYFAYSGILLKNEEENWRNSNCFIWDQHFCLEENKIPISEINKVKCLEEPAGENCCKLKISRKSENMIVAANISGGSGLSDHFIWFSKIILNKLHSLNHYETCAFKKSNPPKTAQQEHIIEGKIYKRSQHLCNWEQRFIVITKSKLVSYKENSDKPSFIIDAANVKYIWTRFDFYKQFLILKVKHGMFKTEFGIPVSDYSAKVNGNWLLAFYELMMSES